LLRPTNPRAYDIARPISVRASRQFRIQLDTNTYSVPAQYAGQRLTLKAYPDLVCVYHGEQLVARHPRCYDRHQDREDPQHPKALLAQLTIRGQELAHEGQARRARRACTVTVALHLHARR
jgi:hypothetical protein